MMIKRKRVFVVLLLGLLLLSLYGTAQDRRLRAAQSEQFEKVANSLNDGEIVLWVQANGMVRVLVKGTDCGGIELDPARFANDETYKVDFFGPLDDLLSEKTGRPIDNLTDLFVFFDPDVSEETIQEYRPVFRRYKRIHCIDGGCCNKDHGYSCCPNTLNTWFLNDIAGATAGAIVNSVRSVHTSKEYPIRYVEPIVVSDGSLQTFQFGDEETESEETSFFQWLVGLFTSTKSTESPSLIRWLDDKLPESKPHRLDMTITTKGEVVLGSEVPGWKLLPNSIALVIVVFRAPPDNLPLITAAVKRAVIDEVAMHQDNPMMILITCPNPDSATISPALSRDISKPMKDIVVLVPATAQSAHLISETVEQLREQLIPSQSVTVDSLVDKLRILGFLAYMLQHQAEQ